MNGALGLLCVCFAFGPHYCRIKIMSLTQLMEKQYPLPCLLWVLCVKHTWAVITLWLWPKAAFVRFLYSLQYFQLAQQHIWADSQDLVPKAWGVSCCITPGSLPKWHHAFLGFKQPQNELLLAVLAYSLGSSSSSSLIMSPWLFCLPSHLCKLMSYRFGGDSLLLHCVPSSNDTKIRPFWCY